MTKFLNISTDNTLGGSSASDVVVASQKATKTYVDNITLENLHNVVITSPSSGQNLTYDATNQIWKNTSTSATVAWGGITGTLSDQTDLKNALDAKQDVISNLATIESGAAAGATAVQPGDLATVATTGSYNDLTRGCAHRQTCPEVCR